MSARADPASIRSAILEWRQRATALCFCYPALWTALQGISLFEYLKQLDELDSVLQKLEAARDEGV